MQREDRVDRQAAIEAAEEMLYRRLPDLMTAAIDVAVGGNGTLIGQLLARAMGAPRAKEDMDQIARTDEAISRIVRRATDHPEEYNVGGLNTLLGWMGYDLRVEERTDDNVA